MKEFNELINKKETNINRELFNRHFSFQRSSEILMALYNRNDEKKNNNLISVIESGLGGLKVKLKRCLKMKL